MIVNSSVLFYMVLRKPTTHESTHERKVACGNNDMLIACLSLSFVS